ncbi:MAG: TolC family protein [Proteobacteria bacterium]|nr:TolC family protein [Pseudomonadota bacterium]
MISPPMKVFLFLSSLFFIPSLIIAEEFSQSDSVQNDNALYLTMEEGKVLLLKNNLDISIERSGPSIESARLEKAKADLDPSFSASVTRLESHTPLNSRASLSSGGRDAAESENYTLSTGISAKTGYGTEYGFEVENSRTKNSFNNFEPEHDAFAGLRVKQPLLKNSGSDANLYNIRIALKNREISLSELKKRIIDTVADYKKTYWEHVLAVEDLKVKKESLNLAQSLLELNRKKYRAEVISPLEVIQAEAGVAARRESVIIAGKIVGEQENRLKRLIFDDLYAARKSRLVLVDSPSVAPVALDLDESIRDGLLSRPDYEQAKLDLEKKGLSIRYYRKQKAPQIDLEASYGFNGLGNSLGNSFSNMEGNPEWSLGVFLTYPLGDRAAKNDLHISEIEKRRALLALKRLEQDIIVEIDNAIGEVMSNSKRIEVTKVATRLAQEALRAEELKFREGLSTSHDVLQYQEELEEARRKEINAILDYNKSLVELSRVKGTLLIDEKIEIAAIADGDMKEAVKK